MRRPDAGDIAAQLGRAAEAVCRRYLPAGSRKGAYWLVGDIHNTPGRSLFVRLTGPSSGKGAAGRWTDAATGEHGDLLDLIQHSCGLPDLTDTIAEACRFLSLPQPDRDRRHFVSRLPAPAGSREAASRLFAASQPLAGTLAETYLRGRALTVLHDSAALRFHPRCHYRASDNAPPETWPALIAAVTDRAGTLTGVQRTWLARDGRGKAPVETPRRALGDQLGHAVRFGRVDAQRDIAVLAAGEGLETMLSLRQVMPSLPLAAALSAGHLAGLLFPDGLRRLYLARDNDAAGRGAAARITARAQAAGVEAVVLTPHAKDFNDDLRNLGAEALRASLRVQLVPEDVARFLPVRS